MGEDAGRTRGSVRLAATAFHLLTGSPPFHHSNPTVVISQHLTASPPAISGSPSRVVGARSGPRQGLVEGPEGPVRTAAWTSPARWPTDSGWSRLADNDRTEASVPIRPALGAGADTRRNNRRGREIPAARVHRARGPGRAAARGDRPGADPVPRDREASQRRLHPAAVRAAPDRSTRRGTAAVRPPTTTATAPAARRLPGRWSSGPTVRRRAAPHHRERLDRLLLDAADHRRHDLVAEPGRDPSPTVTVTTDPTEEPLPVEEESPVRVCMQQTGQTRRECRDDIRASNGRPAADHDPGRGRPAGADRPGAPVRVGGRRPQVRRCGRIVHRDSRIAATRPAAVAGAGAHGTRPRRCAHRDGGAGRRHPHRARDRRRGVCPGWRRRLRAWAASHASPTTGRVAGESGDRSGLASAL